MLGFCYNIKAQDKYFIRKHPKLESEVNQAIYDMYVDDKGLLFLGTNSGLVSFDGVKVENYSFENHLSFSIDAIQQAPDGTLWCKNFSNEIFYLEKNKLKKDKILSDYLKKSTSLFRDFKFIEDEIYILLEKELIKYNIENQKLQVLISPIDKTNSFYDFDYDKSTKNLILLSNGSVYFIKDDQLKSIQKLEFDSPNIFCIKGNIYQTNRLHNTIFKNFKNQSFQKFDNKIVIYDVLDVDDSIWLATSSGFYVFDENEKIFKIFDLEGIKTTDIVKDFEGNFWISSLENGVFYMPNLNLKKLGNELKYKSKAFTSLVSDKDLIYAGTSTGEILLFNEDNSHFKTLNTNTNFEIEFLYPQPQKLYTSRGYFDKTKNYEFEKIYLGKSLSKDEWGNFLISSYNLAGILNSNLKGIPNNFSDNLNDFKSFETKIFVLRYTRSRTNIYSKSQKKYLIGYSDALYSYDDELNHEEIKYNNHEIIAMDLLEDDDKNIWVASNRNGILKLNKNHVSKVINTDNGLSDNKTKSIKFYKNKLWILTESGIDVYDIKNKKLINISNRLGINNIIINDILLKNSQLYMATNQGLLSIDINIINNFIQPFFEVQVFNAERETFNQSSFAYEDKIKIKFDAIYYKSLGDFDYAYKLLPIQKTWQKQKADFNEITLFSIPAGEYELISKIDDENIISKTQTLKFTVEKPYWQQWWFIMIGLLLSLILLGITLTVLNRKQQKKQVFKEELAISQLTALRSQMNPHFMFNVLNAIQGLMYSNQKLKANEFLGKFAQLMRNILEKSEKSTISLQEEIKTLSLYIDLEQSRFEDEDFSYDIHIQDDIEQENTYLPSMIIQPFVENAIKHGLMHKRGKKKLIIEFKRLSKYLLEVIIEDNGIGIKASNALNKPIKNHKSFATNAINKRVKLMNKFNKKPIEIETKDLMSNNDGNPIGTLVKLKIPIN